MRVVPIAASELGLPVFCLAGASFDALSPLSVGGGRAGVHWRPTHLGIEVDEIRLTSYPVLRDSSWYRTKFNRESNQGDWRLDNFLRAALDFRDDEDALDWERRVDELWTVAGDPNRWETMTLRIDSEQFPAGVLILAGRVLARVRAGSADLELEMPERLLSSPDGTLPFLRRLTLEEVQTLLDARNRLHG